jgi:predicted lysophospholipase L1 biosynthesis ABC-type transport system permease subunit
MPGVERVALAGWPLFDGSSMNNFISINGAPPGPVLAYFLNVSPGWMDVLKMSFVEGRDFRSDDTSPGAAIVNQAFARQFFPDGSPIGRWFNRGSRRYQVVGLVRDAPYRSLREAILPVAYVPFHPVGTSGDLDPIRQGAFIVRTSSANPLALANTLRREVSEARSEFRVNNLGTQEELIRAQSVRERLLAMLALFFAAVALLLAGIGLYGVLDYGVLQRRREIGIRMAIGAQAGDIARRVTADIFSWVLFGALAGVVLGMASVRYIEALLYGVKPTDAAMLGLPAITIVAAALVAAVPAVIHAVRIDPVSMLRAD